MCIQTLGIALTVVGGLAELIGLGIVALEIRSDRQKAAQLFTPDEVPKPPARDFPEAPSKGALENVFAPRLGPQLTQSQFGRSVASGFEGTTRLALETYETSVTHTDKTAYEVREEVRDQFLAVRADLYNVLAGDAKRRVAGVAAIGFGLVLATAGSVLGNL